MLIIIAIIIFGMVISYFATQNTTHVTLMLAGYLLTVPLYFVAVGSLLIGFFISWIISIIQSFSSFLTIHGKDTKLKETEKELNDLTNKLHNLELENIKLKTEENEHQKSLRPAFE